MPTKSSIVRIQVQKLTAAAVPLALLACMVLVLAMACASEPRAIASQAVTDTAIQETPTPAPATPTPVVRSPTALPDPPQVFSDAIERLMPWAECHLDRMDGALQRPRVGPYAEVKYQSEVFEPGQMVSREDKLGWDQAHLMPVFTAELQGQCLELAPLDAEWTTEIEYFVAEFSKMSTQMLSTGLLSPWMAENCHEWQRTTGINYVSWRKGSVSRRGEQSGLFFDWHYGKAHERLLAVCATH